MIVHPFSANVYVNPTWVQQQKFSAQEDSYQGLIPLSVSHLYLEKLVLRYHVLPEHDSHEMHLQLITHFPVELILSYCPWWRSEPGNASLVTGTKCRLRDSMAPVPVCSVLYSNNWTSYTTIHSRDGCTGGKHGRFSVLCFNNIRFSIIYTADHLH